LEYWINAKCCEKIVNQIKKPKKQIPKHNKPHLGFVFWDLGFKKSPYILALILNSIHAQDRPNIPVLQ